MHCPVIRVKETLQQLASSNKLITFEKWEDAKFLSFIKQESFQHSQAAGI
jgi:hypothetical protein